MHGNILYLPFPNPTNDGVIQSYFIDIKRDLTMSVFDMNGKLMKTIFENQTHRPGNHKVEFEVGDLPAGNYFIRMSGKDFVLNRKLVKF